MISWDKKQVRKIRIGGDNGKIKVEGHTIKINQKCQHYTEKEKCKKSWDKIK